MLSKKAAVRLPYAQVCPTGAIGEGAGDAACIPRSACEEVGSSEVRPEGAIGYAPPAVLPWTLAANAANAASIHGLDVVFAERPSG